MSYQNEEVITALMIVVEYQFRVEIMKKYQLFSQDCVTICELSCDLLCKQMPVYENQWTEIVQMIKTQEKTCSH